MPPEVAHAPKERNVTRVAALHALWKLSGEFGTCSFPRKNGVMVPRLAVPVRRSSKSMIHPANSRCSLFMMLAWLCSLAVAARLPGRRIRAGFSPQRVRLRRRNSRRSFACRPGSKSNGGSRTADSQADQPEVRRAGAAAGKQFRRVPVSGCIRPVVARPDHDFGGR